MSRRILVWGVLALVVLGGLYLVYVQTQIPGPGSAIEELTGFLYVIGMAAVGCLVLVRQPQNRMGWLFCGVAVLWTASNIALRMSDLLRSGSGGSAALAPYLALVGSLSSNIAWITSVTFLFLLFPNGHLPSPRWRILAWTIVAMVAVISVSSLVAPGPLSQRDDVDNPLGIEALRGSAAALDSLFVVVFFCVLASLLSVFFRYRRADAVVRQQIKWIAFFGAVVAALYAVTEISRAAGVSEAIMQVLQDVGAIVFASFPLVVGFAILYARLWDIDVVIRKTLVYTALTVLLALVYFGIVVLLQVLFSRLAGVQQSTLAVVLSTLAIAALFTPLRRRIQAIIDRRFYRKKYDAQRVLADFAITARDETDMNALAAELARVVQETMAPETVKVWLRRIPGRGS